MKKTIIKIALLFAVLLAFACEPPEWHYTRSMIMTYYEPYEFKADKATRVENAIVVSFTDGPTHYTYNDSRIAYDILCEKHNDMTYNREVKVMFPGNVITHIAKDFTTLEIISDMDWDAEHPAGSSLGDITMFYSVSPIKYINSGYNDKFDWSKLGDYPVFEKYFRTDTNLGMKQDKGCYHPVIKFVSELSPEDMVLLGGGSHSTVAILEFTSLPIENKEHNITVTLTTDEGETFSATTNMVFE